MKRAFRKFRRSDKGDYFYIQDCETGEQHSLGTKDEAEAQSLLDAKNKSRYQPALNLQFARIYAKASDAKLATRTWQEAMDELTSHGKPQSQARCRREMAGRAFDIIRNKSILITTGDDLRAVLKRGGSATNNYLRRLHNLAVGNGWCFGVIIPPKQWEKPKKGEKRGITFDEHKQIIEAEQNQERRNYYEFLWYVGAAQTDAALMTANNINWQEKTVSYYRQKTGEFCSLRMGASLEALVLKLPKQGFLFPHIATLSNIDRSAEFARRRRLLKLNGISLHSYRYSWAERAYSAGYDERFSKAALGHKSSAVHHGYAKKAHVICPPLEDGKIIPFVQSQPQLEQMAN